MEPWIQIGFAVLVIGAIFGLSWVIATVQTNREFGRRDRAEKAAGKIRDLSFATRIAFRDQQKRMPLALDKVLQDSWETYRRLSERSWWVRNEAGVTAIAT